jgi:hypothetical protein
MAKDYKVIIVSGDPLLGFDFIGPFEDEEEALAHVERNWDDIGPSYWLARLKEY